MRECNASSSVDKERFKPTSEVNHEICARRCTLCAIIRKIKATSPPCVTSSCASAVHTACPTPRSFSSAAPKNGGLHALNANVPSSLPKSACASCASLLEPCKVESLTGTLQPCCCCSCDCCSCCSSQSLAKMHCVLLFFLKVMLDCANVPFS